MVEWIFLQGFLAVNQKSLEMMMVISLAKQNFGPGSTMKKALNDLLTELQLWNVPQKCYSSHLFYVNFTICCIFLKIQNPFFLLLHLCSMVFCPSPWLFIQFWIFATIHLFFSSFSILLMKLPRHLSNTFLPVFVTSILYFLGLLHEVTMGHYYRIQFIFCSIVYPVVYFKSSVFSFLP